MFNIWGTIIVNKVQDPCSHLILMIDVYGVGFSFPRVTIFLDDYTVDADEVGEGYTAYSQVPLKP